MLSKNQLGFLYMFMSICAFSLMDVIVKWSVDYPIGQVLFFRGFFGIIFYFFVIPRNRLNKVIAREKKKEITLTGSVDASCLNVIATYERPSQKIIGKI